MRQISNKELEGSKQTVLIDVRELGEFKGGHIQGAKNIPLSQLNRRLGEIPKDRDLLLYCRSGMRSKKCGEDSDEERFYPAGSLARWYQRLDRLGVEAINGRVNPFSYG
ncbi:rhodanese-like domain-containing protein [Paenibacillus sp. P26]|nr:rhodanese-like domain-containing protein [Paenibacillus sp. P26]